MARPNGKQVLITATGLLALVIAGLGWWLIDLDGRVRAHAEWADDRSVEAFSRLSAIEAEIKALRYICEKTASQVERLVEKR